MGSDKRPGRTAISISTKIVKQQNTFRLFASDRAVKLKYSVLTEYVITIIYVNHSTEINRNYVHIILKFPASINKQSTALLNFTAFKTCTVTETK